MKKLLLSILPISLLLVAGCSNTISRNNVDDWPFKEGYDKAKIICSGGKPTVAVINGRYYALNGLVATQQKLPTLTTGTGIFAPHPDPYLGSRGIKAWLVTFREAAAKKC